MDAFDWLAQWDPDHDRRNAEAFALSDLLHQRWVRILRDTRVSDMSQLLTGLLLFTAAELAVMLAQAPAEAREEMLNLFVDRLARGIRRVWAEEERP
jgi:hypothetical protein